MLTNTILRQLFLCPTAASVPKLIADAPCSDVAHHSAAPRRCIPLQPPSPRRSPGLTENVSALLTSSLSSFRYAPPPHCIARICCLHDAVLAMECVMAGASQMRYYGIVETTHPDGNPPGCTIINML